MSARTILTGALALGGTLLGCSVVLGIDDLPLPSDPARAEDAAPADVAVAARAEDATAGADAEVIDASAAGMVAVLGGAFRIDAVEVTRDDYDRFLAALATGAVAAKSISHPACGWNQSYQPASDCLTPAGGRAPIACVDWCDAWSFCAWAGKRLCGAIGGCSLPPEERTNRTASQWGQACGGFNQRYPYGSVVNAEACATRDLDGGGAVAVGSRPACEGAPQGVFDMVGNVDEWDDSCAPSPAPDAGPERDSCASWGGSYLESSTIASCVFAATHPRSTRLPSLGFRCCSK